MLELISWSRKGERPHFKRGLDYIAERSFSSARAYFRNGLTKKPDSVFLMAAYSVALAGAGEFPSAKRFARIAIDQDPGLWQSYVCLAHCHNRLGEYEQQQMAAEVLLNIWPDEAGNHIIQADAWNNLGNYQSAGSHAKEAIKLKPSWPHGHLLRGFAHLGMKSPKNAVQDSERSIKYNSEKKMYPLFFDYALAGAIYFRLGNRAAADGKSDEAEEHRKIAVSRFKSGLGDFETEGADRDREIYKKVLLIYEGLSRLDEGRHKPKLEAWLKEISATRMNGLEREREHIRKFLGVA
ncbi:MAG: hypothetical protein KAT43_03385 [Nanoarchaeota archaeon]|nr:hypothetical protein [Nanoarchaeota archaeon]